MCRGEVTDEVLVRRTGCKGGVVVDTGQAAPSDYVDTRDPSTYNG